MDNQKARDSTITDVIVHVFVFIIGVVASIFVLGGDGILMGVLFSGAGTGALWQKQFGKQSGPTDSW